MNVLGVSIGSWVLYRHRNPRSTQGEAESSNNYMWQTARTLGNDFQLSLNISPAEAWFFFITVVKVPFSNCRC